uniref:Putative LOC100750078 [Bombus impatiens] n=1 Tax=Lepeophtheirus salmonis TaxID=72036 RepID=A0A0K2UYT2_LEPSM
MQYSYFVIVYLFAHRIPGSDSIRRKSRCTVPTFSNGKVSVSTKTGIISFKCRKKYRLLGNKESLCENGKIWNEVPFCARAGCSTQISSHYGLLVNNEQGLRMSFTCAKTSHELVGHRILACNGEHWNGTIPFCRRQSFNLSPECTPNSCLDWVVSGFEIGNDTPTSGTGPLIRESNPFYYLESSSRKIAFMESEEMETDKVACVKLEYLMRGATIGFIKITQVYEDLKPDMLIKINDEQGNSWKKITVLTKNPVREGVPFYFRISAVRGEGYLSDIAIRKIIILRSNEDCSKDEDDPIRDPIRHISPTSCFDRCHSNISTFETMWTEGICSCNFPNCEKFSSCCLDIYEECHVKAHSGSSSSNSQKASHDHDFYTSLGITLSLLVLAIVIVSFFVYKIKSSSDYVSNLFSSPHLSENADLQSIVNNRLEQYDEEIIEYNLVSSATVLDETDPPSSLENPFGPISSSKNSNLSLI